MERALETQRAALLRILSGLVFALAFVSHLPAVSMVPRWVHSYVASVLIRAESAAASLVFVSACVLFGPAAGSSMDRPSRLFADGHDDGACIENLLRRIAALRAVLKDLPRYAKRLVQRRATKTEMPSRDRPVISAESVLSEREPCRARLERPPKLRTRLLSILSALTPRDVVWEGFGVSYV